MTPPEMVGIQRLGTANHWAKKRGVLPDLDGGGQTVIDAVTAVLDGDNAGLSSPGDYGDGFTAVTAQGEQKRVQFFVVGLDPGDDVFFSELCGP